MATRKYPNKPAKKHVVALIHANWCGHCQHMMPEWDKMSTQICGRVDIRKIEQQEMGQKMPELQSLVKGGKQIEANGFPTVLKIVNGKLSYYTGDREASKMKAWALNMHGGTRRRRQTRRR